MEEEERFSLKGKLGIKGHQNQGSLTHAMNSRPTHVCYRGSNRFAFKTRSQISGIEKIRSVTSGHIPKIVQLLDDLGMGGN